MIKAGYAVMVTPAEGMGSECWISSSDARLRIRQLHFPVQTVSYSDLGDVAPAPAPANRD